jgi:hypothetical protein
MTRTTLVTKSRYVPPGNYPLDFLESDCGYECQYFDDLDEVTVAFFDIHNFSQSCDKLRRQCGRSSGLLQGFLRDYYAKVISAIDKCNGRVNKIMGDGVFARFDSQYEAAKAGISALSWWSHSRSQKWFRPPFSDDSVGLVVLIGTLDAYPFREGDTNHYNDVSWVGADLNRFFKDSKHKSFTPKRVPHVWLNESAALGISQDVPMVSRRRGRVSNLSRIKPVQIRSNDGEAFRRYFGITVADWNNINEKKRPHRKQGS